MLALLCAVLIVFLSSPSPTFAEHSLSADCTYEMQVWNVNGKTSVNRQLVRHARSEMGIHETDPETGCTVCSEDQEVVDVPPVPKFSLCYKLVPLVRFVLKDLIPKGAPIHTVVGYHVIKSRGGIDSSGNRTEFSNHSFGTAFDINPEQNGLYDNCVKFGPECKLIRGGAWKPGTVGTLEKNGLIVKTLDQTGFLWGGEIEGKQKDFMHFSLTGY